MTLLNIAVLSHSKRKKKGPSENVEDNVQSVRFFHPFARDAARKRFGLGNESSPPLNPKYHQPLRQTVLDAITALNNGYLDALQLESASALTMRRQMLPLTRAFLEVSCHSCSSYIMSV